LFEILPQFHEYGLYKHAASAKWTKLVPYASAEAIRPYPESNTLGIYFNNGSIELYINGNLESTYRDQAPYNSGDFGAYVDDSGFTLFVTHFFASY